MYYRRCECCGAHLDPGEHCDCKEQKAEKEKTFYELFAIEKDGQIVMEATSS